MGRDERAREGATDDWGKGDTLLPERGREKGDGLEDQRQDTAGGLGRATADEGDVAEGGVAGGGVRDTLRVEKADELAGGGWSGIDEAHSLSGDLLEDGQQEGIMRTAKHDGVGAGLEQRLQAGADNLLSARAFKLKALDELDEAATDALDDLDVAGVGIAGVEILRGLEGAGGGENADHAAARPEGGRLHRRLHTDEKIGRASCRERV